MRFTNADIIAAINSIEDIIKDDTPLPGKVGWTMKQNKKRLLNEYQSYDESLKSIEADQNSGEWRTQVADLLAAETEVPIATVKPDLLFEKEYAPKVFDALDFMLEA